MKYFKNNIKRSALVISISIASCGIAMADISVDKSTGVLNITSDIDGTVIAKVIGPDDTVVVNERYQGNSFSWSPVSGLDGAYRYDVRVVANNEEARVTNGSATQNDYAGGSLEVLNGLIISDEVISNETL